MRILLPYWLGAPERCFYQEFHSGIEEALQEFGHETVRFGFAERGPVAMQEALKLSEQLQTAPCSAVLDLACWSFGLSQVMLSDANGNGQPIFDAYGTVYVQWLFDQPCFQQMTTVMARSRYALYPDLGHPEQVCLLYPSLGLSGEAFAPPAIRPTRNHSASGWAEGRDIDVLYFGNLVTDAIERGWNHHIDARWPADFSPAFCNALADAVLENPDLALHSIAQTVIARWGPMPATFNLRVHFAEVEHFLRHTIRRDAVLALARSGIRLQVVGDGWAKIELPANVVLGEKTDYAGMFQLAARAKICLDASSYLNGANDRIFSYALNRAVCFTNASGYLRQVFGENAGVYFYSIRNLPEFAERVTDLLARPAALQEEGERAAIAVLAAHTWRDRVPLVLKAIQSQAK